MLSSSVSENLGRLAVQFQTALPFPHVCMDRFFEDAVAENILKDFPSFDSTSKTNEFGLDGLKAVKENLSSVSPFYARLVDFLKSKDFHRVIEEITGIKDLHWGGESMYGGGTHENINGAELDPHVDFNYDDRTKEHRRLNLLIYLNKEWQKEWGGDFELHSNPRNPNTNQIMSFLPSFNRALLMVTDERSWHGFPQIRLPAGMSHLSRKSIALYFYTKDRPAAEVHGGHGTFYVQRPLPASFRPGVTVTEDLYREVVNLVSKRDAFMELAHQREVQAAAQFTALESFHRYVLSCIRFPMLGWAKQDGEINGYFPDGWFGSHASGVFVAVRDIRTVVMRCYVPAHARFPMVLDFLMDEHGVRRQVDAEGIVELRVGVDLKSGLSAIMSFSSNTTTSGLAAGINGDARDVAVLLVNMEFE